LQKSPIKGGSFVLIEQIYRSEGLKKPDGKSLISESRWMTV